MGDLLGKKLSELMGKMDDKMLQAKLNAALDMLGKGNTDDLAKKLNKINKGELMNKLNEIDDSRLKEMNLNKNDMKQKIQGADLDKISALLGEHGDEIIAKIKDIIK